MSQSLKGKKIGSGSQLDLSRQKLNTPANQVSTWHSPHPSQKRLTTARSPVDSGKSGGYYQLPRPELTRSRPEQSGLGVSGVARAPVCIHEWPWVALTQDLLGSGELPSNTCYLGKGWTEAASYVSIQKLDTLDLTRTMVHIVN